MADPWETRIPLNPSYTPTKDAGTSMPSPTTGTVDRGINDMTASDSASTTDISNNVTTTPAPENDTVSWGGIVNPYK